MTISLAYRIASMNPMVPPAVENFRPEIIESLYERLRGEAKSIEAARMPERFTSGMP